LTDTDVTTVVTGHILRYDGATWYNVSPAVASIPDPLALGGFQGGSFSNFAGTGAAPFPLGLKTNSITTQALGDLLIDGPVSIRDSAGTTQIRVGSIPSFPNGLTSEGETVLTSVSAALGFVTTDTAQTISGAKTFQGTQGFQTVQALTIQSPASNTLIIQPQSGQGITCRSQDLGTRWSITALNTLVIYGALIEDTIEDSSGSNVFIESLGHVGATEMINMTKTLNTNDMISLNHSLGICVDASSSGASSAALQGVGNGATGHGVRGRSIGSGATAAGVFAEATTAMGLLVWTNTFPVFGADKTKPIARIHRDENVGLGWGLNQSPMLDLIEDLAAAATTVETMINLDVQGGLPAAGKVIVNLDLQTSVLDANNYWLKRQRRSDFFWRLDGFLSTPGTILCTSLTQVSAAEDLYIDGPVSIRDSSLTTQIRIGSIPVFPNGFTSEGVTSIATVDSQYFTSSGDVEFNITGAGGYYSFWNKTDDPSLELLYLENDYFYTGQYAEFEDEVFIYGPMSCASANIFGLVDIDATTSGAGAKTVDITSFNGTGGDNRTTLNVVHRLTGTNCAAVRVASTSLIMSTTGSVFLAHLKRDHDIGPALPYADNGAILYLEDDLNGLDKDDAPTIWAKWSGGSTAGKEFLRFDKGAAAPDSTTFLFRSAQNPSTFYLDLAGNLTLPGDLVIGGSIDAVAGQDLDLSPGAGASFLNLFGPGGAEVIQIEDDQVQHYQTSYFVEGLKTTFTNVSGAAAIDAEDHILLVDASGGDATLTFAVSQYSWWRVKVKTAPGANDIILQGASGTIDGAATYDGLRTQYQAVDVYCDGVNFWIF
jgi:hypothetical protein